MSVTGRRYFLNPHFLIKFRIRKRKVRRETELELNPLQHHLAFAIAGSDSHCNHPLHSSASRSTPDYTQWQRLSRAWPAGARKGSASARLQHPSDRSSDASPALPHSASQTRSTYTRPSHQSRTRQARYLISRTKVRGSYLSTPASAIRWTQTTRSI